MTTIYTFDRESAKLIARTHQRTRVLPLDIQKTTPRRRQVYDAPIPRLICKTDSDGIPARTGTTPSSGTVTLQKEDADGAFQATSKTFTAYHMGSAEVAADTFVYIAQQHGKWYVVWEDCGGG